MIKRIDEQAYWNHTDDQKMQEFTEMSKIQTYADLFREYKADKGHLDFFKWIAQLGELYRTYNL